MGQIEDYPRHNQKNVNFWLILVVVIGVVAISYCNSRQKLPTPLKDGDGSTIPAPVVQVSINPEVGTESVTSGEGADTIEREKSGIQVINAAPFLDSKLDEVGK